MSDYALQQAEAKTQRDSDYNDWVEANKEMLIEEYADWITDFPKSAYEGYLDDDFEKAEETYLNNLTLAQIDNDWLSSRYESYREHGDEE